MNKRNIWNSLMMVATMISPKLNTKLQYHHIFGKKLDLEHPVTSNEKILWLKLNTYYKNPLVTRCADKYAVRGYVEEQGCGEILNPIIGVYNSPEEIEWEKLPKKFALKSNYYYSYNIICKDKYQLDKEAAIKEMKMWMKSKGHLIASEMQYADIERKIICEEFIETKDGGSPADYKIYCNYGKPSYIMVCLGREKGHKPSFYYFDVEGKLQREMTADGKKAPADFHYETPAGWKEMLHYAEVLSKPFPFVRADFYLEDGHVIFGELTFTPSKGLDAAKQKISDQILGDLIELPIAK